MSLNNISLSPQLMADLYATSLIERPIPGNHHVSTKFLGENQKNILILVSNEKVAFLEDDELNFLSSVLNACKLNVADIAIVNILHTPTSNYRELITELNSNIALLFDVEAQAIDLPFNFPHFQLQQFDRCTYLSAPALQNIEKNKALKTQLWNSLKKLFSI